MITADISVKKRNGRGTETLDLNKIHIMVEEACQGLSGVSASQVEIQSQLSLYNGISTADIQETLIRSASDLIDLDHPNYQFVAARLLLFALRKSIYHKMYESWSFEEQIVYGIKKGLYYPAILDYYTQEEIEELDMKIRESGLEDDNDEETSDDEDDKDQNVSRPDEAEGQRPNLSSVMNMTDMSKLSLGRRRHVQIVYLWMRELIAPDVALKHFVLSKVGTLLNMADVLTKQ